MCAPANCVCAVALRISMTPSPQIISTKIRSSQSKSRNETYRDMELSEPGRGGSQWQSWLGSVDQEMSSLQLVVAGLIPHGSHICVMVSFRHLGWEPALLVYVGFDDLCRQTRRQPAVFTPFEQDNYDDFRIAPRRETHEPSILSESFAVRMLGASGQRDDLCRSRFSSYIYSRDVRRWRRTLRQQYPPHRVGDEIPSVGFNWNVRHVQIVISGDIGLWKLG